VSFFPVGRTEDLVRGGEVVVATRVISIIGRKSAGKTTLLVALAGELTRRGRRVMTIKEGIDPAEIAREGEDARRHWHEGNAERVLLEGPGARVLLERTREHADPMTLARRYLAGADIVLVEGFERAPLPKIEVYRAGTGAGPLFDAAGDDRAAWVALVTDDLAFRAPIPVLRFSDTAWLFTLAALAWDRAAPLAP
jgi:molybdopterin-guanine dinucleotide biosynthesis protein MobB